MVEVVMEPTVSVRMVRHRVMRWTLCSREVISQLNTSSKHPHTDQFSGMFLP